MEAKNLDKVNALFKSYKHVDSKLKSWSHGTRTLVLILADEIPHSASGDRVFKIRNDGPTFDAVLRELLDKQTELKNHLKRLGVKV